jgi:hypothetical protein
MAKGLIIGGILSLLLFSAGRLSGESCNQLQNASSDELISYLQGGNFGDDDSQCAEFAIRTLGRKRYEPAIPSLIKVLDFRRPLTEREKQGLYLHIQSIDEIYPAASALEDLGEKALPAVLDAIKAKSTSAVGRANAVFVWMTFYKSESPKGVSLLRTELDRAEDSTTRENMKWGLTKAISWCNPRDKVECEAAARDRK